MALARLDPARIIVVMEENHAAVTILGAHDLPNFTRLEHAGHGAHQLLLGRAPLAPELPRDHEAVRNRALPTTVAPAPTAYRTLANQLQHAGISAGSCLYAQGLPSTCPHVVSVHSYARRHVPFLYYDDVVNNPSMCAHIVPYHAVRVSTPATIDFPRSSMVIPDIDHDMHGHAANEDSNADRRTAKRASADVFIGSLYDTLRSSPAWHHDTRLVVTWDEAGTDNPKPRTCCGGGAPGHIDDDRRRASCTAHGTDGATYDHYALLRSIEDLYHLPRLGKAGDANSRGYPFDRPLNDQATRRSERTRRRARAPVLRAEAHVADARPRPGRAHREPAASRERLRRSRGSDAPR